MTDQVTNGVSPGVSSSKDRWRQWARRRQEQSQQQAQGQYNRMADVEMTDAGASSNVKSSKAGPSGEAGEKKRFEVKKVRRHTPKPTRICCGSGTNSVHDSGTPSPSGPGTSSSTIAPSAATTSWTCASTARPIRLPPRAKSAQWLGGSVT